jgi:hypothetical protein
MPRHGNTRRSRKPNSRHSGKHGRGLDKRLKEAKKERCSKTAKSLKEMFRERWAAKQKENEDG